MKTTFLKLKTAVVFNAEVGRSKGAEEDEENSVSVLRYQGGGKPELPNLG